MHRHVLSQETYSNINIDFHGLAFAANSISRMLRECVMDFLPFVRDSARCVQIPKYVSHRTLHQTSPWKKEREDLPFPFVSIKLHLEVLVILGHSF